ncbi:MAG: amidohydrolase [Bacteroidetes bacterium]|nr:amidohydrolase [Bacteroidota bacterium]
MKFITSLIITLLLIQVISNGQNRSGFDKEVAKQAEYALALCKHIHQNPEISFQEKETSARIADELKSIGFDVTSNFGGNNVVGMFRNGEGPVIMLRTDMDALPIKEKTGFDFASTKTMIDSNGKEVPVMHACGHDIHMSVLVGTVRTLVRMKDQWKGTLLIIAQQAEEMSGGASLAIEEGLFKKFPVPDYALAYHINPEIESGKIGLIPGPIFAGVKTVEITVFGIGGHGAYPEKCIDPVVIASRVVLDLQTIVSREISPLEPVVVTVGSIHGGTRPNIIPEEVKMELTLRYYDNNAIEQTIDAIKRISKGAAITAGLPDNKLPKVWVIPSETPPVLNDADLCGKIRKYSSGILGKENIVRVNPAMVGEDFGIYGRTPEKVPICLIWLGSTNPEVMNDYIAKGEEPPPLHSPFLNPDYPATIETGIKAMVSNVIGLFNGE